MTDVISRWSSRLAADLDSPSPAVKQSATAVAVTFASVLALIVPGVGFTDTAAAVVGISIVAAATVLSLVFTHWSRFARHVLIIPVIDLLGIGAFCAGTGGSGSLFAALIILPVVWLAAAEGRRWIACAGLGTSIALAIPYLIELSWPTDAEWLRVLFTPAMVVIAAGIINELARQSRVQLRSIKTLADEKDAALKGSLEDATRLTESEAKYREYDRMFRGVWAAVTEQSMIGTNATGQIDLWNPGATKMLGPDAEHTENQRHILDFHLQNELLALAKELDYPPGETVLNPGFSALVESARRGRAESRDWTYVRDDGTHVPVQLTVTKRVGEEGETRGYLFVASDITQALEVAKLKDEFVGLISHELRTPLSSILGYLELMRDDDDNPLSEEHLQYLAVAERNAHRLLRLVGDLLFTAQVESGKFPLDSREVSLDAIITAAVESARPIADAAGIQLAAKLSESRAVVFGDPVRLGQAVDNLISNAIKFTPRAGQVTVALGVTPASAVVTVSDTGMGIAASELDQLFSRFFRATTATRNAVPGVGLGLTITKAIVTAHHGEMDVESEEGVGTRFSLTLPLSSVNA